MSLKDLILNLLLLLCVSTELKRMQQYAGTASCLYYTSLHSDSHSLISVLKFDLKRSWDGFFLLLFEYVPWGLLIMLISFLHKNMWKNDYFQPSFWTSLRNRLFLMGGSFKASQWSATVMIG